MLCKGNHILIKEMPEQYSAKKEQNKHVELKALHSHALRFLFVLFF